MATQDKKSVTGPGRSRLHASDSQRVASFRSAKVRVEVLLPQETGARLSEIASSLDCSRNELLLSLVKFALTNRDWRRLGLWGEKQNVDRLRESFDKGSGNAPTA
jgi:hypothetical protein